MPKGTATYPYHRGSASPCYRSRALTRAGGAYPDLAKHVTLTLVWRPTLTLTLTLALTLTLTLALTPALTTEQVEAGPRLMPAFDAALVEHMMTQLATRDVDVRIGTRVKALTLTLALTLAPTPTLTLT